MQYPQSPCNSSSSPGALFRVWAIVFHPSFALLVVVVVGHNGYLHWSSMSMIEHKRLTVQNCQEESISIETGWKLQMMTCVVCNRFLKLSIPESVSLGKDLHLCLNKVLNPTSSSQFCRVINEKIHVRFMWINKIVLIVILADLQNHHHNQNPQKPIKISMRGCVSDFCWEQRRLG